MTSHEPECPCQCDYDCGGPCWCPELRAAYRRGLADRRTAVQEARLQGYREGYNDHARSQQHWQDTHGAYRQHGEGENP